MLVVKPAWTEFKDPFSCAYSWRSTAVCSVIANWPNELKRTSPVEGPARGVLFVNHRLATVLRGKVQDTPRTTGEPLGPSTCQKRSLSTTSTEHQGRSSECPPLLQLVAVQFAALLHNLEIIEMDCWDDDDGSWEKRSRKYDSLFHQIS